MLKTILYFMISAGFGLPHHNVRRSSAPRLTKSLSSYLFFNCLTSVLIVLYYNDLLGTGFNVTSNLEVCFEMIVKVLIVATLGSLVRGIFYARSSKPAALAMPFRVFAFVLVGLVSLLTIVFLGVAMHATFSSSSRSFQSAMHANKIWGAIQIVLFIVSLALVAIAGFTFTKVKSMAHLRTVSNTRKKTL